MVQNLLVCLMRFGNEKKYVYSFKKSIWTDQNDRSCIAFLSDVGTYGWLGNNVTGWGLAGDTSRPICTVKGLFQISIGVGTYTGNAGKEEQADGEKGDEQQGGIAVLEKGGTG